MKRIWMFSVIFYCALILLSCLSLQALEKPYSTEDVKHMSDAEKKECVKKNIAFLQTFRKCIGCYLVGAHLAGMNLQRVDLTDANLEEARAQGASFNSAILKSARLKNALLRAADLTNSNTSEANFTGADLTDTQLNPNMRSDRIGFPDTEYEQ